MAINARMIVAPRMQDSLSARIASDAVCCQTAEFRATIDVAVMPGVL
jgi:hypothetical protein